MPGADDYDVLVTPRDNPVGVAWIVHVGQGLELPSCLSDSVDGLKVSLRIGDAATRDEDLPSHFN